MKGRKYSTRIIGFLLAFVMVFTMIPVSNLRAEGEENGSPLSVAWTPSGETFKAGETGNVNLTANLRDDQAAEVQIALSAQEAEMLTDFWNEDGSLKTQAVADTGQIVTLAQQGDGSYCLGFTLQAGTSLSKTLAVSAPADHQTAAYFMEVTSEDVSSLNRDTKEPVAANVTGGKMSFQSSFGWTASIASAPEDQPLNLQGETLSDYVAHMSILPLEDETRLYTKSQGIRLMISFPEGIALPEGEYTYSYTENTGTVSVNGAELLVLDGTAENMQVTTERKDAQNLELTVSRTQEDIAVGDMVGLDVSVRIKGAALECDSAVVSESAQISLNGNITSVSWADTKDEQEISAAAAVTVTESAGESSEEAELWGKEEKETDAVGATNNGNENARSANSGISIVKSEKIDSENVYWIDNNNEEGKRPDEFSPRLYFNYVNEDGSEIAGEVPRELTEDNMEALGLTEMPEITVESVGSGQYEVSVEGELPTQVTYTDEYGDTPSDYPRYIQWSLEAPDVDGYSFCEITDENQDLYPSANGRNGWYYVIYDNYTITFTLRSGSFTPDEDLMEDALLGSFVLYIDSGATETPIEIAFRDLASQGRFDITAEEEGVSGRITILDLWRYNLDGSPIIYNVKSNNNSFSVNGMEEGDSYTVIYDNTGVPNYGATTDAVYSGGTVYLTLTGTTDYSATKEWLDTEGNKRPAGEIQLWRYREGATYNTAAPVRDSNGNILTIELTGDDPQSINFPVEGTMVDGVLNGLPKYDTEGHRYIYVAREYLDGTATDGSGADSYEQVFGDVLEDGTVKDTLPDGTERASGNTFVYDEGTLSNRVRGTVETRATKTWEASAFQTEFDDVAVEVTLQSRPAGSMDEAAWTNVLDDNGDPVRERMEDFYAESLQLSIVKSVSRYDALGRELEYRWIETGVYQGEGSSDNLLQADGTFTLEQSGREIIYRSESPVSNDLLSTNIVNRIANTIDYDIEKIWLDENGEETEAPEGAEVTFVIYQTLSGEELSNDKIVATVKMDGVPDTEVTVLENGLTFQETEAWIGKVDLLPEFSDGGAQYEYTLMEAGGVNNYFPTYETERSEEDYGYDTRVINQPGDGNRIMVRKDWVDDSDVEHRGAVTIGAYSRETNELVAEVTLRNGVWTDWIHIGNLEPEEVYILETSVETDQKYETGAETLKEDETVPATHRFETDNHRYEVHYAEAQQIQNDTMYSVENRRLGNIDMTVTKNWRDGDGSIREELQKALDSLDADEKITPALRLEFAEEDAGTPGYEISYSSVDKADTVTLGGEKVYITDEEGNPASSVQRLDLDGKSSEYYFYNLPKYDPSGDIAHYTAREVWVLESNSEIYTLADLANSDNEKYQEIYELVKDYSTSYGDMTYDVSTQHDRDKQTIEVINRLSGSKTLTWYKEWNDAYNDLNNLRPDIYLDIYRVVHTDADTTKTELYLANYRWTQDEGDTSTGWQAQISGAPKYDDLGYEITYYAVENTNIDAASFDYMDTEYKLGSTDGEDSDLGTEYNPEEKAKEEGLVIDISESDSDSSEEAHYALVENGTFINNIKSTVSIRGYKLWTNLPAGYDPADLPGVTFALMRSVNDEDPEEVATLTIQNWADISINGRYSIGFDYYGENVLTVEDGEIVVTGPKGEDSEKLDKYDKNGNLYTYTIEEKEILWQDKDKAPDSSDDNPMYNIDPANNTYQMTNGYVGVSGQIDVKKLLQLPMKDDNTPEAYPAVTFKLTRTYTTNAGEESKEETIAQKTISSAEVKKAYEEGSSPADGKVSLTLTFDNVPKYAPNGSEYVYSVEEVKTNLNGYDTWADGKDYSLDAWDQLTVDENNTTKVSGLTAENDAVIDATFANAQPEDPDTITLSGTKQWNDYENVFGFRPNKEAFIASLVVYRSADSQPGQDNAVERQKVEANILDISVDGTASAPTWSYQISGKDGRKELERYAPNGMPWKYTIEETLPNGNVYTVSPKTASGSAGANGNITIGQITNSIQTSVSYNKHWVDENGNPITEDYLGVDLTVEYTLQVAETDKADNIITGSGDAWSSAEEYFDKYLDKDTREKVFGDNYDFTPTLTGRINSDIWETGGTLRNLPKVIKKNGGNDETYLTYRVVERAIKYGDNSQDITTVSTDDNRGYTYAYGRGLFQSGQDTYQNKGNYTAVNKLPTTDFKVIKQWAGDNNNIYGSRPDTGRTGYTWEVSFVVQRSADNGQTWENVQEHNEDSGEDLIITLYGDDANDPAASDSISGLPKTDLKGNTYTYRARELQPSYTLENGAVKDEDIVTGDGDNRIFHDTYQASYADNAAERPNTTTAVNSLNSTRIYAAKEWIGADNTAVNLTLQYKAEKDGKDTWISLATVTVNGVADNEAVYYEYEPWKAVWKDLPEVLAGSKLDTDGKTQYRVVETVPGGYQQVASEVDVEKDNGTEYPKYIFTNMKTVSLAVTKAWSVSGNYQVPDGITVGLYRTTGSSIPADAGDYEVAVDKDGNPITLTLNAGNKWSGTFSSLPKYDEDGIAYIYYARELDASGSPYDTAEETSTLRIIHNDNGTAGDNAFNTSIRNIERISITGTKTWLDNGNAYGTRPEDLVLTLSRSINGGNAETVDAEPVWSDQDSDQWRYLYTGLPYADDNGNIYTYTVTEATPEAGTAGDRYEGTQEGNDFTNTLSGVTTVSGIKTWYDGSNADQIRPDNITLTLYRRAGNGEEEAVTNAVPAWDKTSMDQWTYTYTNLPKYNSQGVLYTYRVEENVPDGYERTAQDGYNFTNTQITSVDVQKIWGVGGGIQLPEYVTIGLYRTENADGSEMSPVVDTDGKQLTLDLNAENEWKGTFDNLLKYNKDTGVRYYYGIAEIYVSGGEGNSIGDYIIHYNGSEESGFVVTNIAPITITGTKTWVDNENTYGTRPENLELTLYRNIMGSKEEIVDVQPEWTKDGNIWTYTYKDLPLTDDDGNVYTYRVEETKVTPEGDAGEAGDSYELAQDGYDFINTLTGTTKVTGTKTWRDNGRTDRGSIELILYANGEELKSMTLEGKGDTWEYSFDDLPKYDEKGAIIEYTVREDNGSAGYDVSYTEDGIVNTQQGSLYIEKTVTGTGGDKERKFSFTVTLNDKTISGIYGDLTFVDGTAKIDLSDGESVQADGLPADIGYIVTEDDVKKDGYTVKSEGDKGTIQPGEVSKVSFVNHKDAPAAAADGNAKTGEGNDVILYLALAILAILMAVMAFILKRRQKR